MMTQESVSKHHQNGSDPRNQHEPEGLTDSEKQEAALLSHFFNRVMLVRAKAAVLLKERGHDVDQLLNS